MAKNAMARSGRRVLALTADQFAATQSFKSSLNGAFRKTGLFGERAQTSGNWLPVIPRSAAVKVEKYQISGRLLIMADQIAHQDVEHVIVERDCFFESRQEKLRR
jgi:hypothetical protein